MSFELPEKLEFMLEPHPFKVLFGGRDSVKSWTAASLLVLGGIKPSFIGFKQKSLRILCARETMKSIKGSSHQELCDQIKRLGLESKYRILESAIIGVETPTEFRFIGLKDPNALKSSAGVDIVWVEEANQVSQDSWDKLIPTLRKEHSEIWVTYNPELDTDDTHQRFVINPMDGVRSCFMTWEDNNWLSDKSRMMIEDLRRRDPDKYAHIYGGQTVSAVQGAIFKKEMAAVDEDGRICRVIHDPNRPVQTFWDLGFEDMTSIWFGQLFGGQYRMIDYMQSEGRTIQWYLREMAAKPYVYGTHYLPWDGTVAYKKLGSGKSAFEIFSKMGKKVWLTSMISKIDRINALRSIFPQVLFDRDACVDGVQSLRHYQWGERKEGQRQIEPLHNSASHGSDALMVMAVGAKFPEHKEEDEQPRGRVRAPALLTGGNYGWMG